MPPEFPPEMSANLREQTRRQGEGYRLPPSPPEIFGVTREEGLAWVRSRLVPQPFKTYLDPVQISNPKAARIPHTYISCQHPHSLLEQFVDRIRLDRTWQFWEMTSGHDAMVVKPEKLSLLLLKRAATT